MSLSPLCLLSATELARRVRSREVSSVEAVTAHIERIREVNPRLNALVAERFEHALAEAREADARISREGTDGLPLFHGVPCTIKESFAFKGMPNTAGLVARKGRLATFDAPAVERLRSAGAIALGVSNVSELCLWMESNNCVYGRTGSAFDPTRTAGGSSGGEGALVGAGASPFGLGADVGGSIRMPAFFNGVFGHKPSPGLVPNAGQFPNAPPASQRMLGTGPIARRAEDLLPLLEVLAGPHEGDPYARALPIGDPASVRASKLTVYVVEDPGPVPPVPALRDAIERAARALAARGARVEYTKIPALRRNIELWGAMLADNDGPSFLEMLGDGTAVFPPRVALEWALRRSPHTLPAVAFAFIEQATAMLGKEGTREALALGDAVRADLHAKLAAPAVLLFPPHPRPAPKHATPMLLPIQWGYTALFNALEVPVTQVPTGLDARGLPLGVQVVGAPLHDHVTIAVARWLEEDLGGWSPPRALA